MPTTVEELCHALDMLEGMNGLPPSHSVYIAVGETLVRATGTFVNPRNSELLIYHHPDFLGVTDCIVQMIDSAVTECRSQHLGGGFSVMLHPNVVRLSVRKMHLQFISSDGDGLYLVAEL